jgi:hypothetical protein
MFQNMNYLLFSSHYSAHIQIQTDLITVIAISFPERYDHFKQLSAYFEVYVTRAHHFCNTRVAIHRWQAQLPFEHADPSCFSMHFSKAGIDQEKKVVELWQHEVLTAHDRHSVS